MSRHQVNTVESLNPSTTNLVLRGKNVIIEGENGQVVFTGNETPGGGGGGGAADFIFRPSAPPSGNVYDDLGVLLTAAQAIPGKKRILLDIDLNTNVAGGSYNFIDCDVKYYNWQQTFQGPKIIFGNGTTIVNFPDNLGAAFEFENTSSYPYSVPLSETIFLSLNEFGRITSVAYPVVYVPNTSFLYLITQDFSGDIVCSPAFAQVDVGGAFAAIDAAKMPFLTEASDLIQGGGALVLYSAGGMPYSGTNPFHGGTSTLQHQGSTTIATTWNANVPYNIGEIVFDSGTPYISLQTSNLNNLVSDPLFWKSLDGGGSTNDVVIFEPSIVATTGNRYKTWSEVMTAINATTGPIDLLINNPGLSLTIPINDGGSYDLSRCKIGVVPYSGTLFPVLDFIDGTTLTGFPHSLELCIIAGNNTTNPLFTLTSGIRFCALRAAGIVNSGSQPVIKINSGAHMNFVMEVQCGLSITGGQEVIEVDGNAKFSIYGCQTGFFSANNLIKGTGSVTIDIFAADAPKYIATHSGLASLTVNEYSRDNITSIAALNSYSVVFNPGESTNGNSYQTFEECVAALYNIPETQNSSDAKIKRTIYVHSPIPNTVISIAGNVMHSIHNWNIATTYPTINPTLDFGDDTTFIEFPSVERNVTLRFNNTTSPVCSTNSAQSSFVVEGKIINFGTQAVFRSLYSDEVILKGFCELIPTTSEIFDINFGQTLTVVATDYAKINANNIYKGLGNINIKDYTLRQKSDSGYGNHVNLSGQITYKNYSEQSVFDLVGVNDALARSISSVAAAELNDWRSVAYGNGVFVAVSATGTNRVMRSTDGGLSWNAILAAENNNWRSVAFGDGVFVAVSGSGTNQIMRSTDGGTTWTPIAAPSSAQWSAVTFGDGVFIAVADSGPGIQSMRSIDGGITWLAFSIPNGSWQDVAFGNGVFVAVSSFSNKIVRSLNKGQTWLSATEPENNPWFGVAYSNGVFVAVANTGTNKIMRSIDNGATWTAHNLSFGSPWGCVAGRGVFVVVGQGTNITRSVDGGLTWISVSGAEANNWYRAAYGAGYFVAISNDGTNRVMRMV